MAYPGTLQIDYAAPYETTTSQLYPLGQKAEDPSGAIFRYSLMGGVVGIANMLYQSSLPVTNWVTQTHTVALAVGDTEISFDDGGTALTVNQAQNGTILVEETDDLGHIYFIKSNVVTVSTETICQLHDGVTVQNAVAVDTGNVLTLLLSPWAETLIVPTTTPTALIIGIPRVLIAASAHGWIQARGVASCRNTGSVVVGQEVIPAGTTAGTVAPGISQTTNITAYVGKILEAGPTTDFGHIFLTLE